MLTPLHRRCAHRLTATSSAIPTFLLPAFQPPTAAAVRTFATTSPCQSKIGSQPLSIPPEVTLQIVPPSGRAARGARTLDTKTVKIKGPLGELVYDIPAYVNIETKPDSPGPVLSVQDSRDAKQRAMWGMQSIDMDSVHKSRGD